MKLTDFASELQKHMPDGTVIDRIEDHCGTLRGLVLRDGAAKYFSYDRDQPISPELVLSVAASILRSTQ